ncbi:MAG: hypothetical protein KY445_01870 [Armatimonadetes bacterium]|nr:hypothetical protein [Armatimonadota bacterium]
MNSSRHTPKVEEKQSRIEAGNFRRDTQKRRCKPVFGIFCRYRYFRRDTQKKTGFRSFFCVSLRKFGLFAYLCGSNYVYLRKKLRIPAEIFGPFLRIPAEEIAYTCGNGFQKFGFQKPTNGLFAV